MEAVLSFLQGIFSSYPHVLLFFALLIGGEIILLPVMYATFFGRFDAVFVVLAALFAAMTSDTFWYVTGRLGRLKKFHSFSFYQKHQKTFERVSEAMKKNGLKFVFLSKFIYGTRTAAQILAGVYKLPYGRYLAVDVAGTLALIGLLFAIALFVNRTFAQTSAIAIQLAFAVFIIIAIIVQVWLKKTLQKRWYR